MSRNNTQAVVTIQPESRLPAVLALLAMGGLYLVLPDQLTAGPSWLLLAIVVTLLIPAIVSHRMGNTKLNYVLGFAVSAVITLALAWSLGTLIAGLPGKRQPPPELLRSAAALWLTDSRIHFPI